MPQLITGHLSGVAAQKPEAGGTSGTYRLSGARAAPCAPIGHIDRITARLSPVTEKTRRETIDDEISPSLEIFRYDNHAARPLTLKTLSIPLHSIAAVTRQPHGINWLCFPPLLRWEGHWTALLASALKRIDENEIGIMKLRAASCRELPVKKTVSGPDSADPGKSEADHV